MHHFDSRLLEIRNQQSPINNGHQNSGDNSAVAPPVPIPNTEVKRCSPDGSTATGRARVGRRQSKMPGGLFHRAFCLSGVVYLSTARRNAACRRRTEWLATAR